MVRIRHQRTFVEQDVPDGAVPYFPDYDVIGDPADKIPPRSGAGSGAEAWAAYAAHNNVEVAADARRDDIIAALDEVGVPTEIKE